MQNKRGQDKNRKNDNAIKESSVSRMREPKGLQFYPKKAENNAYC